MKQSYTVSNINYEKRKLKEATREPGLLLSLCFAVLEALLHLDANLLPF